MVIKWMYIRMMGGEGLKKEKEDEIINENYIENSMKGV